MWPVPPFRPKFWVVMFYADSFFADQGEVNAIDPTKQLAKEGDGIELEATI